MITIMEVEKIKIMSPHGFNMKLLVQNGLASKVYMTDFFTMKKLK